ncbi:MAG: C4-dicarboxylate ABC transporter substrate-binding protein [Candidatus Dactylopiibacterium carminicum]|nr:MAG: C4-dicarboxylate ABC transporter substrate-binding protein [Candidatus Dactylopiibacterium carminicum]
MKSAIKRLALALSTVFLAGPALAADPAPITVRVVTPFASGHLLADTAAKFKEELEKQARHITVAIQTGVLNEQSIDPAFKACTREELVGEILLTGGQPIQDYAPEYFFFNGPYVIRDFKHLQSVWHSKIGKQLGTLLEKNGNMVSFDPVYRGYRQFTANKPIHTPADFTGVKLRLPPVPDWIAVWQSLGVAPVQVALPEIYNALKSGAAEASEGDLTQIQSMKLNEVQSQLVLTNHLVGFGMQLANGCFYNKELSKADQKKVAQALEKAAQWGSRTIQERETSVIDALKAGGMSVVTPDAAAIRKAAEPSINELFKTKWTVTTWQQVLAY